MFLFLKKVISFGIVFFLGTSFFLWQEGRKVPFGGAFYMFNVPVGDAFFFVTPHGHTIFIDGGVDETPVQKLSSILPVWQRTIDLLIISHPDKDHLIGGLEVLKRYQVGTVLLSGVFVDRAEFSEFLYEVKRRNIPLLLAQTDQDFYIDGVFFDVLAPFSPFAGTLVSNVNDSSVVLRVLFGKTQFLLTGDIEKDTETDLLKHPFSIKSDVLKVAHHGSKSSSLLPFLEAVRPLLSLISAGPDNSFGHPHAEVVERLQDFSTDVLITKKKGDIRLSSFLKENMQIQYDHL